MSHFPKVNLKFHQAGMRAAQTGRTLASVIEEAGHIADPGFEEREDAGPPRNRYEEAESKSFSLLVGWIDGAFASIRR